MPDDVIVLVAVWVVMMGVWLELRGLRKWMEQQTKEKQND
jgi:hypothetical protein